jgi:glutathione peroxidase-family protein
MMAPYFPTPNENRKQFEPLFNTLAEQVNLPKPRIVIKFWNFQSFVLKSQNIDSINSIVSIAARQPGQNCRIVSGFLMMGNG